MTRILWVSDHPEAPTGFGTVTNIVCRSLSQAGIDVHILCLGESGPVRKWQGCTIHITGAFIPGSAAIGNLMPELRPDFVITVGDPMWFISFVKQGGEREIHRYGAKWVLYYPLDGELENGRIPDDWIKILEIVDIPIAVSRYTQRLSERCGIEAELIPHGVSTMIFSPPSKKEEAKARFGYTGKFVVLSDARNQPRKKLPRLLETFAEFSRSRPDAILHLHCDPADPFSGLEPNALLEMIDQLGIKEQTRFTPNFRFNLGIPIDELAKIYQAADVHLLVSGGEGFGLPSLQAASSGLVPFAPDYSANSEIIDGHGELIKVQVFTKGPFGIKRAVIDVDDCVQRLIRYYNDHSLLEIVGSKARVAALTFDWPLIIRMWLDLFKKVANNVPKMKNNPWISSEDVLLTSSQIKASREVKDALLPFFSHIPAGITIRARIDSVKVCPRQSPTPLKYPVSYVRPRDLSSLRIVQLYADKYTVNRTPGYDNGIFCWLLNCDAFGIGSGINTESSILNALTRYDIVLLTLFRAWIGWTRRIKAKWSGKIIGLSDPPLSEIVQWPLHTQKEFVQDISQQDGVLALTRAEEQFYKKITDAPVLYIGLPFPFQQYQMRFALKDVLQDQSLVTLGVGGSLSDRNFLSNVLVYQELRKNHKLHGQIASVFNNDADAVSHVLSLAPEVKLRLRIGWEEYLRSIASSRIIINLSTRNSPGRIAGEAAFLGVPCVGSGEQELQNICWPQLTVSPFDINGAIQRAEKLLTDMNFYQRSVEYARGQLQQFDEPHSLSRLYAFLERLVN